MKDMKLNASTILLSLATLCKVFTIFLMKGSLLDCGIIDERLEGSHRSPPPEKKIRHRSI